MYYSEKGTISDFVTIIIWGVMTIFTLVFFLFFQRVSSNTMMKNYSADVISRHGGITSAAISEIHKYSEENFWGSYELVSKPEAIQPYGKKIDFELVGKFKVLYFEIPLSLSFKGTTTSKIR